ncbi:MAG TPA: hypothetical protein VJP78_01595 [Thermoleophilia bacterium]|nr:hypothetical protein [Thermoleophilia bacterium]
MKKKFLSILLLLMTLGVMTGASSSALAQLTKRGTSTTLCQNVSTTAVTILAGNGQRLFYSMWTTSGAVTIYWRENGTAVAQASHSGPLTGGLSYTDDGSEMVTSAVSAITASGTAWVCVKSY